MGYLSFSRAGAELLFQVFTDRYERASLLLTSNLAFSDWGQVFQGERMVFSFGNCTLRMIFRAYARFN
ncbi:MAG: ATP-binding protein [Thermoguttaceae bacterium]